MTATMIHARGRITSTAAGTVVLHNGCVQCGARCARPTTFRLDGLPITGQPTEEIEVSAAGRALTFAAIICFGVPLIGFVVLYFGSLTILSHWPALLVATCGALGCVSWASRAGAMINQRLAVSLSYVTPEDVS